ncbi:MAG: DUF3696 domain-containing protein [Verrucomicrobia bacterium]|nr:DUF3696 domain-containing protein [Verrucomicrobiota bacterium]MCG2679925.1 DUF3696 domain-containing protein [Kiritimatiellia bacterium]MBU4247269.1 DUF3696 domain-containing protein [Verrucomicrobiota bacterium]MBU4290550.1 DUF3696 domain-containing protein [Verrucomicrobiota bacterium]MBU4428510.1 DUF3696 domain-containing protein [Verrucomicrobiota bacterium]
MIKQIEIENFKCFGDRVSIPLAPITLIYGENSSGKSTILQAITLMKNALPKLKLENGKTKDQEKASEKNPIPFSSHYDGTPSDIKELTHDGKKDKPISISFQRDARNVSMRFISMSDGNDMQVEASISSEGNLLAALKWEGSSYKWNYGWILGGELIKRTYTELHKRKVDVVEGYKRLIEYETINSYLNSWVTWNGMDIDIGANIYQESKDHKFLEGKWRDGLQNWVRTGFQGYTDYVKGDGYKESYQKYAQRYSKAIAAYTGELSFDDFCNLHFSSDWKSVGTVVDDCLSLDNAIIASLVPDLSAYVDDTVDHGIYTGGDPVPFHGILLKLIPTKTLWSDSQLPSDYSDLSKQWETPFCHFEHLLKAEAVKVLNHKDEMIPDIHSLPAVREQPKASYSDAKANLIFEPIIIRRINDWLNKFEVGYTICADQYGSLRFVDERRDSSLISPKITEVGFGFSQLLPIIADCWRPQPSVITIEQPELHIHPRLQAELGSLFTDACQKRGHQIIAETHSEHLMLRLQKLIRKKELKAEDVCVLYVSREKEGSRVQQLRLDDEGSFIDRWPRGFFPERTNEILD